jgi:hypothetical protein
MGIKIGIARELDNRFAGRGAPSLRCFFRHFLRICRDFFGPGVGAHSVAAPRRPRVNPQTLFDGLALVPRFDPPTSGFSEMHRYRSHTCGALRDSDIGETVRLSGWCHRIRDHGGVLFIDLRDHYGLTQCVVDPDSPAFKDAEKLRSEWVVRIDGKVRRRPAGTDNHGIADRRGRALRQRDRGAGPGRRIAAAGVWRAGIS